jgi:hypothetical protein
VAVSGAGGAAGAVDGHGRGVAQGVERFLAGELDQPLGRGALDLFDQDLLGRGDRLVLAGELRGLGRGLVLRLRRSERPGIGGRSGLDPGRGLCRCLRHGEARGRPVLAGARGLGPGQERGRVAVLHVEREVARADEARADPAVAAELHADRGARVGPLGLDREHARARHAQEDLAGGEIERAAREEQRRAPSAGLERPFGRRLDGHHDAREIRMLARTDRPALLRRGRPREGGQRDAEPQCRPRDHAARLCLVARIASSSAL